MTWLLCPLQLHLYDLVAVRKQQMGTSQPLKRTARTSLADAAARLVLTTYPAVPMGKENSPANMTHSLTLPIHTAGKPKAGQSNSPPVATGEIHHQSDTALDGRQS